MARSMIAIALSAELYARDSLLTCALPKTLTNAVGFTGYTSIVGPNKYMNAMYWSIPHIYWEPTFPPARELIEWFNKLDSQENRNYMPAQHLADIMQKPTYGAIRIGHDMWADIESWGDPGYFDLVAFREISTPFN